MVDNSNKWKLIRVVSNNIINKTTTQATTIITSKLTRTMDVLRNDIPCDVKSFIL